MRKKLFAGLLVLAFACLALPGALADNFQEEAIALWQNFTFPISLAVYCLPALLWRFVIWRKPLPWKWGSMAAMIYGLTVTMAALAFSIFYMGIYSGGLVVMSLVWIWLEYKILTMGGKKGTDAVERRKVQFCPYCGARLQEDSRYCPQCGAKVQREEYKGPEL